MPDRPAAALRFDAIGTNWSITALTPLEHAREAILAAVEDFDRTYSRFRPDSLIRQFGDQGGTVRFPPDAVAMFALIDQLHDATGGAFDPTVAAALEHLGYNEHYTLTPSPGDPPPRGARGPASPRTPDRCSPPAIPRLVRFRD